jgi:Zn-dependent peptidase ImmA (M78 family)
MRLVMSNRGRWYSDEELREIARAVRKFFGIEGSKKVDVVACVRANRILTVAGVKRLILQIVNDDLMLGTDAEYSRDGECAVIRVRASVYESAEAGMHRARMTLAHELGHVVLDHRHEVLARLAGIKSSTPMSPLVSSFEKPAYGFASHFLVDISLAAYCVSYFEISTDFGVSLEAARIIFEKIENKRNKGKIIGEFEKLQRDLSRGGYSESSSTNDNLQVPANQNNEVEITDLFTWMPCQCGGRRHPFAGNKFRCDKCHEVSDPPDGDTFGTLSRR